MSELPKIYMKILRRLTGFWGAYPLYQDLEPGMVGRRVPANCTSGGKMLLALLPAAELAGRLPHPLPRVTRKSVTSRARLLREIAAARASGYAVDEFWEPIAARADGSLILDPGEFYILASKEAVQVHKPAPPEQKK